MASDLESARAIRDASLKSWSHNQTEFQVWRPTPTRAESQLIAAGDLVILKDWDLSPIEPWALDPEEPPGRPDDGRPANTALPVVTGIAQVGETLTADNGVWTYAPTGYAHQWRRGRHDIAGATGLEYVLASGDTDYLISVRVTAENPIGPAAAISLGVGPTLPAVPIGSIIPVVYGQTGIGSVLRTSIGSWNGAPDPDKYQFEWRRDWVTIIGANERTYTVTPADAGAWISSGVRAGNRGGMSSTVFSTPVGPAAGQPVPTLPPVNTVIPRVIGLTVVGRTLTSSNGSWDNYPTSFARQWRADTVDIPGANDVSYVCLPADLGAMMSVQVTATNSVGSDTATSLEVGPVVDSVGPSPINTVPPVITGMMMVGQTLSVSTGTWDNAPTGFAYEWRRGAVVIAGATAATLVLQPIDEGWRIYCTVTATNANGSTDALTENTRPIVGAGLPYCTVLPVVTGDTRIGEILSTDDGTWINAPTSLTYGWTRNGLLAPVYTPDFELTQAEITAMIASRITASNALGSTRFDSIPVGPVVPIGA